MRKLEYTITKQDGAIRVRQVMKEKLDLSAKEISHAKHFEDGITACLNLNCGGEERRRLHRDLYKRKDELCRCAEQPSEHVRHVQVEQPSESLYCAIAGERVQYIHAEQIEAAVQVRVNEQLYPGEKLTVTLHEMEDDRGRIKPVPGPIDIIYEDDDIILLNKPAGIVAHPSPGHTDDSLANRLAYYYEVKNDPHRIRIIGRLDKEASGVLLFAKTRMAARALRKEGAYDKEYLALCSGFFSKGDERGTIKFPILKRPEVILKREISSDGETAVTHYRVISQGNEMALVRLTLETGRTHQIRLHMSAIGHPLVGDLIYHQTGEVGAEQNVHAMLHAQKMHITHPVSRQEMTFTAEIPEDMLELIAKIQVNAQGNEHKEKGE